MWRRQLLERAKEQDCDQLSEYTLHSTLHLFLREAAVVARQDWCIWINYSLYHLLQRSNAGIVYQRWLTVFLVPVWVDYVMEIRWIARRSNNRATSYTNATKTRQGCFVLFHILISCVTEESQSLTAAFMKVQTEQNRNKKPMPFQSQVSQGDGIVYTKSVMPTESFHQNWKMLTMYAYSSRYFSYTTWRHFPQHRTYSNYRHSWMANSLFIERFRSQRYTYIISNRRLICERRIDKAGKESVRCLPYGANPSSA